VTPDPFTALGLPIRPDLTDDDVRAAWRRIAAATHPDRADGGDPARFAVAAAAYTDLRTRYGRGEAYADLADSHGRRAPASARTAQPTTASSPAPRESPQGPPDQSQRDPRGGRYGFATLLAFRAWRGRPAALGLRLAIAAAISGAAFAVLGGQPAAAGLTTGAVTWFLLTAGHDLAPPGS
jgi:curved DNA-binding protein CbpA